MEQDNIVAQVYQESYMAAKADGEREMNELRDLHDRFDYYLDEERMANKKETYWYDLKAIDDGNQVEYSTDFTDQADDLMYKRYKLLRFQTRESVKDHQVRIQNLIQEEEAQRIVIEEVSAAQEDDRRGDEMDYASVIMKLREKKFEFERVDRRLEDAIAELKYQKALRNKDKIL